MNDHSEAKAGDTVPAAGESLRPEAEAGNTGWTAEAGVEELLALYRGELAGVSFPGADLSVLEEAVERARSTGAALSAALAQVEQARQSLDQARTELLQKCQRALAYARVFAEDAPELAKRLDSFSLPLSSSSGPGLNTGGPPAAPRRRGRPPKSLTAVPLFPTNDSGAAASGENEKTVLSLSR